MSFEPMMTVTRAAGVPCRGQRLEHGQLSVEDVLDACAVDAEVDEAVVPTTTGEAFVQLPDPAAVGRARADALRHRVAERHPERLDTPAAARLWDSHHAAYGCTCSCTARTAGTRVDKVDRTGPRGRWLWFE